MVHNDGVIGACMRTVVSYKVSESIALRLGGNVLESKNENEQRPKCHPKGCEYGWARRNRRRESERQKRTTMDVR